MAAAAPIILTAEDIIRICSTEEGKALFGVDWELFRRESQGRCFWFDMYYTNEEGDHCQFKIQFDATKPFKQISPYTTEDALLADARRQKYGAAGHIEGRVVRGIHPSILISSPEDPRDPNSGESQLFTALSILGEIFDAEAQKIAPSVGRAARGFDPRFTGSNTIKRIRKERRDPIVATDGSAVQVDFISLEIRAGNDKDGKRSADAPIRARCYVQNGPRDFEHMADVTDGNIHEVMRGATAKGVLIPTITISTMGINMKFTVSTLIMTPFPKSAVADPTPEDLFGEPLSGEAAAAEAEMRALNIE
jgi:hypothetical protein